MKKFEALTIVECPYSERYGLDYEMAWRIEKGKVISDLFPITRQETYNFNLCGVYHKAGVPFEIREIKYRPIQDMGLHEVIIKAFPTCVVSLEKKKALLLTGYLLCSGYRRRNSEGSWEKYKNRNCLARFSCRYKHTFLIAKWHFG